MKLPSQPRQSGRSTLLLLAAIAMIPVALLAAGPAWWTNYGVLNGNSPNDFAAATQGQAKNMATAAVSELDNDLAQFGGAGAQLDALAATLLANETSGTAGVNDFSAINLGQLKYLAQPFYDRLLALGYYGPPLATGTYPWVGSGLVPNDYSVGNIGQLKELFSFDVTASTDGNGLPDWWLLKYYDALTVSGTAINPNGFVAWSGSQVTILQAYQNGWNPVDYYNGKTPILSIVSGNGQTGPPGGFVPAPLVVSVTDTNGNPLAGAPVTFTVTSGGGQLQKSNITSPVSALSLLTDSNGHAQGFFLLPNTPSNTSQITVEAGPAGGPAQVIFDESSDNGSGGPYRSPFSPSNVVGVINADGSEDMTWQNNTDPNDATAIPIWYWNPGTQTWRAYDSVPAGTTHYHFPPNP